MTQHIMLNIFSRYGNMEIREDKPRQQSRANQKIHNQFQPKLLIVMILILGIGGYLAIKIANYSPSASKAKRAEIIATITAPTTEPEQWITAEPNNIQTSKPAPPTPTIEPTAPAKREPTAPATIEPTALATIDPTAEPGPTSTPIVIIQRVYPTATPTIEPSLYPNFRPLPPGFNIEWCAKIQAQSIFLPDGSRLTANNNFVYLSLEAINLPLIVEIDNWYNEFTFSECGEYTK